MFVGSEARGTKAVFPSGQGRRLPGTMDPGPGPGALLLAGMGDVPAHAIHSRFEEMWLKLSGGKLHGKRRVDALEAPTTSGRASPTSGVQHGHAKNTTAEGWSSEQDAPGKRRKTLWTPAEINIFTSTYRKHGLDKTLLARELPNKTKKQIANFYNNSKKKLGLDNIELPDRAQRPAKRNGKRLAPKRATKASCRPVTGRPRLWTEEDISTFVSGFQEKGRDWTALALLLPGKTPKQVRNFHTNNRRQYGLDEIEPCFSKPKRAKKGKKGKKEPRKPRETMAGKECLICFEDLSGARAQGCRQLNPCGHWFHRNCIKQWLKKQNTCPVCRVGIRTFEGETLEDRNQHGLFEYYDTVRCQACNSGEREHEIILCDSCDVGYHMGCLDPPLTELPQGEWFCPECEPHQPGYSARENEQPAESDTDESVTLTE